jgi:anti-anti-sigma regulatory factor
MSPDSLVVVAGLDLDARREFLEVAHRTVDECGLLSTRHVTLDCSSVVALDEGTLGMLVIIARKARRHGLRVVLAHPSVRVSAALEDAGVLSLFTLQMAGAMPTHPSEV